MRKLTTLTVQGSLKLLALSTLSGIEAEEDALNLAAELAYFYLGHLRNQHLPHVSQIFEAADDGRLLAPHLFRKGLPRFHPTGIDLSHVKYYMADLPNIQNGDLEWTASPWAEQGLALAREMAGLNSDDEAAVFCVQLCLEISGALNHYIGNTRLAFTDAAGHLITEQPTVLEKSWGGSFLRLKNRLSAFPWPVAKNSSPRPLLAHPALA